MINNFIKKSSVVMVLSSILINPISIFASESNVYSSNNMPYMQQVDSTTKAEIQKLTSKVYPYLKTVMY